VRTVFCGDGGALHGDTACHDVSADAREARQQFVRAPNWVAAA
jgi:hypothetical protein